MDPLPGVTVRIVICLCWVTATTSFLLYSQPGSLMLLSHYFLSLYFYLCPGILPLSILSTRWSPSLLQKCPKYSYCLLLIFPQQQTSSSYRAQIPMDFSSLLLLSCTLKRNSLEAANLQSSLCTMHSFIRVYPGEKFRRDIGCYNCVFSSGSTSDVCVPNRSSSF